MEEIRETSFTLNSPYKYYSNVLYDKKNGKTYIGISFFDKEWLKEEREGDIFYRIKKEEEFRPDRLSYKFYNTTDLDWLICYANNIKDPLKDLYKGREIIIPSPQDVFDIIKERENLMSTTIIEN